MAKRDDIFREIFDERVTRIVNKVSNLDKKPRDYGTGDLLYPSEIHTIVTLAEHPGVHMAEIAQIMGVTRGAVMQLVNKLEKKGLVERYMEDEDRKKVFIKLTKTGDRAFSGHQEYHQAMYRDLHRSLRNINVSQLELIRDITIKVENHIDSYLEEKKK